MPPLAGKIRPLACALALAALACSASALSAQAADPTHNVLVVGNNWDGTADVVDPYTFKP